MAAIPHIERQHMFGARGSYDVRVRAFLRRQTWARGLYGRWLELVHRRHGLETSINGEPFRLAPEARSVAKWSRDGSTRVHEPELWETLLGELRPDDVVADVGANVGLYSIACARRVPRGRVWAIEPDPRNAALLRRHAELNEVADRITVVEAAAGAETGSIGFAALGIPQAYVEGVQSSQASPIQVPLVRLDETVPRGDVVKIDVEGYEGQVLDGASGLLGDAARRPRLLVLEVHLDFLPAAGWSEERLRTLLQGHGYRIDGEGLPDARLHWVARRVPA
jgi:FkbM family methyltransferase